MDKKLFGSVTPPPPLDQEGLKGLKSKIYLSLPPVYLYAQRKLAEAL